MGGVHSASCAAAPPASASVTSASAASHAGRHGSLTAAGMGAYALQGLLLRDAAATCRARCGLCVGRSGAGCARVLGGQARASKHGAVYAGQHGMPAWAQGGASKSSRRRVCLPVATSRGTALRPLLALGLPSHHAPELAGRALVRDAATPSCRPVRRGTAARTAAPVTPQTRAAAAGGRSDGVASQGTQRDHQAQAGPRCARRTRDCCSRSLQRAGSHARGFWRRGGQCLLRLRPAWSQRAVYSLLSIGSSGWSTSPCS